MTSKPLPPHGTQARYKTCQCQPCREAHNKACQLRELAHLSGRPPLHPRQPIIDHINRLQAAGMNVETIARRSEVPESTIRCLIRGRVERCGRERALRILAVQAGDFDNKAKQPALGTMRRIRALYAAGHSSEAIAAAASLAQSGISAVAHGHKTRISGRTADAVKAAYETLSGLQGTSKSALRQAAAAGWLGPGWWDDDQFENPDYEPTVIKTPRYIALAKDCLELERQGHTREQIAARLNASRDHLERSLSMYRKSQLREAA